MSVVDTLRAIPLFSELREGDIERLALAARERSWTRLVDAVALGRMRDRGRDRRDDRECDQRDGETRQPAGVAHDSSVFVEPSDRERANGRGGERDRSASQICGISES